jgi:hypothetical protein
MSAQAGEWAAGLPYAQRAADHNILGPVLTVGPNALSDPNHIDEGLRLIRLLVDNGYPFDPLAYVVSAAPTIASRPDLVNDLLAAGTTAPAPAALRRRWEDLVASVEARAAQVAEIATTVKATGDQVVDTMNADGQRVEDERSRMEQLVAEVADLANEGAAGHLAKEYAKHAKEEEESADSYTRWSIGFGVVSVLATAVIAYFAFSREHGAGAILTKAALGLPIIVFAGYLGRLATVHRRQAWRWRNIELQIRTARPFVAPLRDEQRELMTAALALRFFPGQRADGETGGTEGADPVSALAELLGPTVQAASRSPAGPQGSDNIS